MKKRAISLIATTALFITVGALGATSAQAETRPTGSATFVSPIVAKPNFFLPLKVEVHQVRLEIQIHLASKFAQ